MWRSLLVHTANPLIQSSSIRHADDNTAMNYNIDLQKHLNHTNTRDNNIYSNSKSNLHKMQKFSNQSYHNTMQQQSQYAPPINDPNYYHDNSVNVMNNLGKYIFIRLKNYWPLLQVRYVR